jgi:amino acid transporter
VIPQGFLGALVRYAVLYALGWLAARGVISADDAATYSGPMIEWATNGIVTLGMVGWLWLRKRRQHLEKEEAASRSAALSAMSRH